MRRGIFAALLLMSSVMWGQGAPAYVRMDFSLQNAQGQAISGANVFVYSQSACGQPPGPEQQLYSSANGGEIHQPLKTDGFGHAAAYLAPVCVTVKYQSPQTGTQTYPDQMPQGGGGGTANPSPPAQSVQLANSTATGLASDPSVTVDPTTHTLGVGDNSTSGTIKVNGGCTGTCATLDSPDGITWRAGQNLSVSGNLQSDAVAIGPSTAPICPNGVGGAFTTSGCVVGGSPGGTNLQMQFNNAGAFGGATGVTVDAATKSIVSGNKFAGSGPPQIDITSAQFGGVCDGVTDIRPALQAAWNALPAVGGEILIPGSPTACYWANPTPYNATNNPTGFDFTGKTGVVVLNINGQLRTGTTFAPPYNSKIPIRGISGGGFTQFQIANRPASIWSRPTTNVPITGTIGTAVTATYTGTGNPTATVPVACDNTHTGEIYNDTNQIMSPLWTCAVTTGSITSGTAALTVANPAGFALGESLIVTGAGAAGANLTTNIDGIAGNVLTLHANASTSVTGNTVTTNAPGVTFGWRPGAFVTITPSSMAGIFPGTWLGIAETATCNLTTTARASNTTTGTFTSYCPIGPGVALVVAGVSDSSFNGTHANGSTSGPFLSKETDNVKNTMTWANTGTDGTSSGGTVTGYNEDTAEPVMVSHTTATTATILFHRLHASTAQFGAAAIGILNGFGGIENIYAMSDGPGMVLNIYKTVLSNIGAGGVGACSGNLTNVGVMMFDSSFVEIKDSALNGYCLPYSVQLDRPWSYAVATNGPITVKNTVTTGGGFSLAHGSTGIEIKDLSFCEQCPRAYVTVDSRYFWSGNSQFVKLSNSFFQDNPQGYRQCQVHQRVPTVAGVPKITSSQIAFGSCIVNENFSGNATYDSGKWGLDDTIRGVAGSFDNGIVKDGEDRGSGSNLSPSSVPFATANIPIDGTGWTGGSCTVTQNIRAKDGSLTAVQLTGGAGGSIMTVGTMTIAAPVVGDFAFFGGWYRTTTPGKTTATGTGSALQIDNNNNATFHFVNPITGLAGFDNGTSVIVGSGAFDTNGINEGWHPIVGIVQITATNGASSVIKLSAGCDSTRTMQYWIPFLGYLPASSGASLVTLEEALNDRMHLLHGAVPPGLPAAGGTLAMPSWSKLYWGSDTNLYRGAANVLKTDGTVNAANGFQVNGSALAMPNLVDVSSASSSTSSYLKCTAVDVSNNCTHWASGVPAGGGTFIGPGSSVDKNLVSFSGTSGGLGQDSGILSTNVVQSTVPPWLQYLGDGSESAPNCAAGCTSGQEHWYASLNVPAGQTLTVSNIIAGAPLIIRSTGTCTIAGTISYSSNTGGAGNTAAANWSGAGGGGGFGAANGTAGSNSTPNAGGAAGTSGVAGGNASGLAASYQKMLLSGNPFTGFIDNLTLAIAPMGGAKGGAGGSSGGAGGNGGGTIVIACATINFTGTIDVSGVNGGAGGANTGGGGGGGGGIVIMRSPNMTNSGTINVAAGTGGAIGTGTSTKGGDGGAGFSKVFSQ